MYRIIDGRSRTSERAKEKWSTWKAIGFQTVAMAPCVGLLVDRSVLADACGGGLRLPRRKAVVYMRLAVHFVCFETTDDNVCTV